MDCSVERIMTDDVWILLFSHSSIFIPVDIQKLKGRVQKLFGIGSQIYGTVPAFSLIYPLSYWTSFSPKKE